MSFSPSAQALAQFLRALRTGEKSFQQRAQVESRSPNEYWQTAARLDLIEHLSRLAGVFAGRDVAVWCYAIEQMMRSAFSFEGGGLGCSDVEFAVHRDGIAVHNLDTEALRQRQRKSRLAAGCRPKHDHQQRFGLHRSHRQRMLQRMACQ